MTNAAPAKELCGNVATSGDWLNAAAAIATAAGEQCDAWRPTRATQPNLIASLISLYSKYLYPRNSSHQNHIQQNYASKFTELVEMLNVKLIF